MNVVLTLPPSEEALNTEKSPEIARGMGLYPPLGILYLASYLDAHSKHSVKVIDPEADALSVDTLVRELNAVGPDLVGITAFTNTWRQVIAIIKEIKALRPRCIVVVGGPHVSLFPKETLSVPEIDYAVCGDGEVSFFELLNAIEQNQSVEHIQGLVFRAPNGIIQHNGFARVPQLDSLPFPNRSYIHHERYYCVLGKKRLMTTIATSRGCPFRCTFCNSPDKQYRERSVTNVVDEMSMLADLHYEEIFFFDDLFNISESRVVSICDEIIRRGLHRRLSWAFRGRANSLTSESVVRKLKEAGCERVQLGIEKATDEGLRRIKKNTTIDEITTAVHWLHRFGIVTVGNFVLFTPGESESDVETIIRFSLKLPLDHCQYHVFAPYPGSEIYDEGVKSGFFKKDYWLEYVLNPQRDIHVVWDEQIPLDRMMGIANAAYRRFYFRPRIVLNELRRLTSWNEFVLKLRAAMTVLRVG